MTENMCNGTFNEILFHSTFYQRGWNGSDDDLDDESEQHRDPFILCEAIHVKEFRGICLIRFPNPLMTYFASELGVCQHQNCLGYDFNCLPHIAVENS